MPLNPTLFTTTRTTTPSSSRDDKPKTVTTSSEDDLLKYPNKMDLIRIQGELYDEIAMPSKANNIIGFNAANNIFESVSKLAYDLPKDKTDWLNHQQYKKTIQAFRSLDIIDSNSQAKCNLVAVFLKKLTDNYNGLAKNYTINHNCHLPTSIVSRRFVEFIPIRLPPHDNDNDDEC